MKKNNDRKYRSTEKHTREEMDRKIRMQSMRTTAISTTITTRTINEIRT